MNFELSSQHQELQESVRLFVEQDVLPQIMRFEEKSVLPLKIFREMGRRGFFKAHIPHDHGGLGLGTLGFCLVSEEVAKAGFGMTHSGHFQTGKMLSEHGTPEQKKRYLNNLLTGTYLAATAITEPTVGSSFSTMQTTVENRGDAFVLNGVKTLINDAAEADIINVFARGDEGISVFLLEKGTPGFRILKKQDPIGMRSSPIYEFELKDCTVAAEQLIGQLGAGFKTFFSAFNFSRLGNASAALGIARASLDKTIAYLKQRQVGERSAAEFQGLRWRVSEMSTELEAARLLRDRAAVMDDQKMDISLESSRVKLLAVQVADRIVGNCIQSTGRYGCMRDSLFDLYLRDVKMLGTAGGSLEVMRNNIARTLLKG